MELPQQRKQPAPSALPRLGQQASWSRATRRRSGSPPKSRPAIAGSEGGKFLSEAHSPCRPSPATRRSQARRPSSRARRGDQPTRTLAPARTSAARRPQADRPSCSKRKGHRCQCQSEHSTGRRRRGLRPSFRFNRRKMLWQPMPARPAFSIGFPPQTPPGWPGPTHEYRMGVLVPFIRFFPYSAGTGSPVSSPVLCMVVQVGGRCARKYDVKNKTFFLKLFVTE